MVKLYDSQNKKMVPSFWKAMLIQSKRSNHNYIHSERLCEKERENQFDPKDPKQKVIFYLLGI